MVNFTYKSIGTVTKTLERGDYIYFNGTVSIVAQLANSFSLIRLADGNRNSDSLGTLEQITKYCQDRGAVLVNIDVTITPFTGK